MLPVGSMSVILDIHYRLSFALLMSAIMQVQVALSQINGCFYLKRNRNCIMPMNALLSLQGGLVSTCLSDWFKSNQSNHYIKCLCQPHFASKPINLCQFLILVPALGHSPLVQYLIAHVTDDYQIKSINVFPIVELLLCA